MGQFAVERIATVSKYLHKIGKILDQLQRTEEQLSCQPKLREALEAAYGDILRIYLEIIRYLRRGTRWCKYYVLGIYILPSVTDSTIYCREANPHLLGPRLRVSLWRDCGGSENKPRICRQRETPCRAYRLPRREV